MHQQEQSETKLIAVLICHLQFKFCFSIHTTLVVIHIVCVSVCVCVCVGRVMLEHSKAALVIAVSALQRRTRVFEGEDVFQGAYTNQTPSSYAFCWTVNFRSTI